MDQKSLVELVIIKNNITPLIVSSVKKIVAKWNATGCFVLYRDKKFLITVKHAFDNIISNGETIKISICQDQWLEFEGVFYKHLHADVAVVEITKEGFSPKNYIELTDKKIELKTTDKFAILGYQNIDKMNCSEKPMLQKSILKSKDYYHDTFSGIAIPGYSGSAIFLLSETKVVQPEFVGILSQSGNHLFKLGANKEVREEGDEIIIQDFNVISSSRLAIQETLSLSFE